MTCWVCDARMRVLPGCAGGDGRTLPPHFGPLPMRLAAECLSVLATSACRSLTSSSKLILFSSSSHVSWADQLINRPWMSPHFTYSRGSCQSYVV